MSEKGTAAVRGVIASVDDMDREVAFFESLLGHGPKFADGDRWTTFDANGFTINLAGSEERLADPLALMVKAEHLEAAVERASADGTLVDPPQRGKHEMRATVRSPSGHLVSLYSPLPAADD